MRLDVSKLDADQMLLTELFGLESTRCASQTRRMRSLLKKTRDGDSEAARGLMAELSRPGVVIRYDVTPTGLEALVDKHKPGWRNRAAGRTAVLRKKGSTRKRVRSGGKSKQSS